jgi:hypothetical protein
MRGYINRRLEGELQRSLDHNPVTALIGPRQCGKSTLARHENVDGRCAHPFCGVTPCSMAKTTNAARLSRPNLRIMRLR